MAGQTETSRQADTQTHSQSVSQSVRQQKDVQMDALGHIGLFKAVLTTHAAS